jgi:sigma-54 dependent transcriptional regulator, acetoin dehydrogenase operon transcriptional activator AcoR
MAMIQSTKEPIYEKFNRKAIKKGWRDLIENRPIQEEGIRPEILSSWKRCREKGLDPFIRELPPVLSKAHLDDLVARNFNLIKATKGVLHSIYEYLNTMNVIILLADKDGFVLETMGEGPVWYFITMGVAIGNCIHESYAGTTAPGLALLHNKPFELFAEEHYRKSLHNCLCAAAPIHNEGGKIIGCLDITLDHRTAPKHPHTLTMIIALAGIIENQIQLLYAMEENYFSNLSLKSAMASMNDGLIIIDGDDTIIHANTMAEKLLGLELQNLLHQRIYNIIKNRSILDAFSKREAIVDQEIILNEPSSGRRCLVTTTFMTNVNGKYIGSTILLKEYKQIQKLIQKVVGPKALYSFSDICGNNIGFKKSLDTCLAVANGSSNIIIAGESGTGKELIAQSIHNASSFAPGPFIAINCASVPHHLIESEMLGYEAGTFTGGLRQGKPGKLEMAKGGTLFLDDINSMSMGMQAKLLRVLEERQFQRLGGNKYISLDARVISATNENLQERIRHGNFRSDLFYRLSVINIHIPPLRERKDDIELLTNRFIEEKNIQLGKNIRSISKEALNYLLSYNWPGNVRELRNWIERAVNLASGEILTVKDFPEPANLPEGEMPFQVSLVESETGLKAIDLYEREIIKAAISECRGNINAAAKKLGVSRATLYRKMEKYEIVLSKEVHL